MGKALEFILLKAKDLTSARQPQTQAGGLNLQLLSPLVRFDISILFT